MKGILILSSLFLTKIALAQVDISSSAQRQAILVCECLTSKNMVIDKMKEEEILYEMRDCQTNATFQQLNDKTIEEAVLTEKELAQTFNETTIQKLNKNCTVVQAIAQALDNTPRPSEVSVAPYFLPKSYWKTNGFVAATADSPNSQLWKHADDALGSSNLWRVVDYRWVFNSAYDAETYWQAKESELSEEGKLLDIETVQMDNLPKMMAIFEDNEDIKTISGAMGLAEQHYCVIFTAQNILCKMHFTLAPNASIVEIVPILEEANRHISKLTIKE